MGIVSWLKGIGSNTLYYPGCLLKGVLKQEFENYKEIFNRLGIDFILLSDDEFCCGLPVLNAGYRKDARDLAKKNFELFKKKNITKIITSCPSCYHMFKEIYPKLVHGWDIEVEHATITIYNKLKHKKFKFDELEIVGYHDPCHLGRYAHTSEEAIYEEPRKVISILGGLIKEFYFNRDESICCGGGGGVRANFKNLAKDIAKKKIEFLPVDAVKIISPCGLCSANFKSVSDKSEEFSSFVLRKLNEIEGKK